MREPATIDGPSRARKPQAPNTMEYPRVTTAKDPPESPASRSDARGLAVIAALIVVATGLLYSQRPHATAAMPPAAESGDPALPGFRADAWFLPDDDLLGFVEIPAGPFLMGSDSKLDPRAFENERWSTSSDQGAVDLSAFYIGRYEVTVAQFRAFVEATGFHADAQALAGRPTSPSLSCHGRTRSPTAGGSRRRCGIRLTLRRR